MKFHGMMRAARLPMAATILSLVLASCVQAAGQTETIPYTFQNSPDGAQPWGGAIADGAGNLYGTTIDGGQYGYGTVYEIIAPTSVGGAWTESVLYSFQGGSDGANPYSNLVFDGSGNLIGTTQGGGNQANCSFCGAVFKLTHPSTTGGAWTEASLYSFDGLHGANPYAGLLYDGTTGRFFGTTYSGGTAEAGVVFQLTPPSGKAGTWTESVLYSFTGGNDGGSPYASLVRDKAGNLYGTALLGGSYGYGSVFELAIPTSKTGPWTESSIYSFTDGSDGAESYGAVAFDATGNLYGTTSVGGNPNCAGGGCGTVFELKPPATKGGAWSEKTLYAFSGLSDGAQPFDNVILDKKGDLYGTSTFGGSSNANCAPYCGTVFELVPPASSSGSWSETTLYQFQGGNDGYAPTANVVVGEESYLYGTAAGGGSASAGIIFRVAP